MWARATSNEPLAKALRIALVFSLVFGISFRVEWLAYAATVAEGVDTAAEHANDELTGLAVYRLSSSNGVVVTSDLLGVASLVGETVPLKLTAGETVQIAGVASWQEKQTEPDDPTPGGGDDPNDNPSGGEGGNTGGGAESGGSAGGSEGTETGGGGGTGSDDGTNTGDNTGNEDNNSDDNTNTGDQTPTDETNVDGQSLSTQSTDSDQATTQTRGISSHGLQIQDDEYVKPANFLQWEVTNDNGVEAISVSSNNETGVLEVTGRTRGTATITCTLSPDASVQTAEGLSGFPIQISVNVAPAPYVQSIELFHESESTLSSSEPTTLSDAERESYAVHARVSVYDELSDQSNSYDLGTDESLSSLRKDLEDLKWEVLDADGKVVNDDVAKVESKGGGATLTLKGDGPVTVRCTSSNGLSGEELSQQFIAQSTNAKEDDKPEDIQGEAHPQDVLTVTVNDPYAKADDDPTKSSESETDGSKSSASADQDASSEAAAATTGKTTSTSFVADGDSSLVPIDSETGQQGAALGARDETYTMSMPDGGTTTVKGRGSTLAMLLDSAGVGVEDQKRIETVEFVSPEMGTTKVQWADLVDVSRDYIMIAPTSYVQELNGQKAQDTSTDANNSADATENGDSGASVDAQAEDEPSENDSGSNGSNSSDGSESTEGGASSDSSSSDSRLLDNTKYRILYEGELGSVNPLSLRYVNQIKVTLGAPENTDKTDPELSISIDYKPVPKDKDAFLSAVPNDKVGASRFGYTWEISTDGGKSWSVYSDQSIQTLRVMTKEPPYGHIGHMFRVILETDLLDDEGNPRGATSDPVTITDSDEFTIVLDYTPPFSGATAIFEAHEYNLDLENKEKVTKWEWWAVVNGEESRIEYAANASSWSTPTQEIDESASSSDAGNNDEAVSMTYIYVVATTSKGRTATSNRQPLTVRVGESDSGPKASDIADRLNNKNQQSDDFSEKFDPDTIPNEDVDLQPTEAPGNYTVQETDVVFDDTQGSLSERMYGEDSTDPTVAGDSPTIVVNDNVSKQIKDQQQAAQQQKESTTPGARWTKLDTINPTNDDLQRILADNPFAPFAMPLGLGVVAAGGLEKLLTFRREL